MLACPRFHLAGARARLGLFMSGDEAMGRSLLLMLLGVPIPLVLLIWFMGW